MPSPFCTAQDGAGAPQNTLNGANATPGNIVTIALTSAAGVSPWTLVCYGTDETNAAATVNASLTINALAKTATFTMPAAGSALLFRSTINNGLGANQLNDPTASTTFGVFSVTLGGYRVGAVNELLESNATYGWLGDINAPIRVAGPYPLIGVKTTTTATTANQIIATIPIAASSGATGIDAIIIAHRTGAIAEVYRAAFATVYYDIGTGPIVVGTDTISDIKTVGTTSAALNSAVSGQNILIRATPWNAGSTVWQVAWQAVGPAT